MADEHDLEPADPAEEGVSEEDAEFSRTEGAHVLASQARESLEGEGFSEQQILDWAEAFVAEEEGGDVEAFLSWVERQQEQSGR
ncbi:MAG: hypothetical protein R3343_05460 [Nitriliruptorales bacterium]|nr:hypothetical protein [Nitriliruptorales bacterium]